MTGNIERANIFSHLAKYINYGTVMKDILSICKALSDQNRLRVAFALLEFDELCVCQVTELLQVSGATVSRHLGVLANAGIINSRKEGRWVILRLEKRKKRLQPVLSWLEKSKKDNRKIMQDYKRLTKILACSREDICRRQRGKSCCP